MPMQMECPAVPTDRVAPIHPHTQETGSMRREGAERVLGLQNKPEVSCSDTCIVIYIVTCSDHMYHLLEVIARNQRNHLKSAIRMKTNYN